jgi:hypothetical protein
VVDFRLVTTFGSWALGIVPWGQTDLFFTRCVLLSLFLVMHTFQPLIFTVPCIRLHAACELGCRLAQKVVHTVLRAPSSLHLTSDYDRYHTRPPASTTRLQFRFRYLHSNLYSPIPRHHCHWSGNEPHPRAEPSTQQTTSPPTMSQTTRPPPAFVSKEDFLAHGLVATTLVEPTDCSICREPLAIIDASATPAPSQPPQVENTYLPRLSIHQEPTTRYTGLNSLGWATISQTSDSEPSEHATNNPSTTIDSEPLPEIPVQIQPCAHIFGSTCIKIWLSTTTSNRCPMCNQVLFPKRHIHLSFREPTRAMRAHFADIVEHILEDPEYAQSLREQLMGQWTRLLMRELAIEMQRAQGFDVTWEYVDRDLEGRPFEDEDEEEEDLFGEEEESEDGESEDNDTDSDYEDEDETDDDDEMEL